MPHKAAVRAISSALPVRKLTNERLTQEFPEWDVEKIHSKTGIAERGVTAEGEYVSDLGIAAAEGLFADGTLAREDVDFLLFCTQSPDYLLPTTACIVQERLGLARTCGALDFNLGCSGFVYGLSLAKGLVETGQAANVLLITAETYTKHLHERDRSVRAIFGDAAAATLITGIDAPHDCIGPFIFGTDGRGAQQLIAPGSGMRRLSDKDLALIPEVEPGVPRPAGALYMNGPEIFNFTLNTVPAAVEALLAKCDLGLADVGHFVFHQANQFMLEALRNKIRIPKDRFIVDMEFHGNTVCASIPLVLEGARHRGQIPDGQRVMLVGFGVGYSWAATLITFV